MNLNNPFNPQEVKMSNYHPETMEARKLDDITKRMHQVNGKNHEYQAGYQPKSYGDVIERPKSYGDVMERPKSYSDNIKKPDDSYSSHLPNKPHYGDMFNGNNN